MIRKSRIVILACLVLLLCFGIIANKINQTSEGQAIYDNYKEFCTKESITLNKVVKWLHAKKGSFYLLLQEDEIDLDTRKGSEYGKEKQNTKLLVSLMRAYNINKIYMLGVEEDIYFVKNSIDKGVFTMDNLIFHKGKPDSENLREYKPVADNFYYYRTYGE